MRHLAAKNYFKAFALVLISARLILSSTEHGCPSIISRITLDSSLWMQTMGSLNQNSILREDQREEIVELVRKLRDLRNLTRNLSRLYVGEVFQRTLEEQESRHYGKIGFDWLRPATYNLTGSIREYPDGWNAELEEILNKTEIKLTHFENAKFELFSLHHGDLSEVLKAGYDTFQRLTNALEFSKLNLERDCGMYINRSGRYWKLASKASNFVVRSLYISLKNDPQFRHLNVVNLPIITRNQIPSNIMYELNGIENAQSRIDERDYFILRATLSNVDRFLVDLYEAFQSRWHPRSTANRATNLNQI